ncbi:MAG TPA: helix-turn-helix transcriptional regulator [Solirubrobacteraceae bacterium]|nr:helix-turn-helix transcriptional regulator [Solirubrobacteraceae bacterium]
MRGGSMRELAAEAGLSTAQISRIESGQVTRPTPATLVALARALWLNPMPLLILAGHIPDDEARGWIKNVLEPGTEVFRDWNGDNPLSVIAARRTAEDENAPREEVHKLAFDLFVGEPMVETEWDSSMALLGVGETDRAQRRLINLFAQLTAERRERMLADLEDQVTLSRIEMHRDADEFLERRLPGIAEA